MQYVMSVLPCYLNHHILKYFNFQVGELVTLFILKWKRFVWRKNFYWLLSLEPCHRIIRQPYEVCKCFHIGINVWNCMKRGILLESFPLKLSPSPISSQLHYTIIYFTFHQRDFVSPVMALAILFIYHGDRSTT